MAHSQKTIALFISGLDDSYNEALCRGVSQACDENSYNLVVLPGSYINRELDIKSENPYAYQFNTLYSYINPANVSGIIIAAGSIGGYTDKADMTAFLNKYKDIPTVISPVSDGVYEIDDMCGGFYYAGRYPGYEPTYDFHADTQFTLNEDGTFNVTKIGNWYFKASFDYGNITGGYDFETGIFDYDFDGLRVTLTPFTL